jgi:hypothetical protein
MRGEAQGDVNAAAKPENLNQETSTRLLIVDIDLLLRPILHPEKAFEVGCCSCWSCW